MGEVADCLHKTEWEKRPGREERDYLPDREIKEVLSSFGTLFGRYTGNVKRPLIRWKIRLAVLLPAPCPAWSPVIIWVGGWKGGGVLIEVKMTMKNKLRREKTLQKPGRGKPATKEKMRKKGVKIAVCWEVGQWEDWTETLRRGREDKPREVLLKTDNEGKIGSEIAYRRSTNSSPHTRPNCTA